ncbi:proton channel OTOP1 isoform X2 [Nerophis ophidion]|uniref:proton channel OTOP1 isoform X2 n=1 Tax=Nerophis ophidion TaxID=159077 RepID=UPI002ADFBD22|nr:proton channel OTOP1 isoform X2 [Nerophis ophidion]
MSPTMMEHSTLTLDAKYCNSSSSSSSSDNDKKTLNRPSVSADEARKKAEILSGQYGTNLLLMGAALMLALAHHNPSIKEDHLLAFVTCLMVLQLLWMMWYVLLRRRHRSALTDKDVHATTCWIRGGLTLLALLSLIMDVFRIGYYVGYQSCVSAVLGVYPVIHATHTIAQVHFLWFHIKDVIKSFETFERFGVIHAVFTNLLLWCNGVMSEAEHFLNNHKRRLSALGYGNLTIVHTEPGCNCSTSTCSIFSSSLYYLYPFNIEYHIFVSAMLFVMWKNIGRTIELSSNRKRLATKTQGLLIYRADRMPPDTSENPSRQLDTELLFGSSMGSWFMSWCSIVAVLGATSSPPYRWTNLTYSLLVVLEKCTQNLFIIESLYRRQEVAGRDDPELAASPQIFSVESALAPPYNGIFNRAYDTPDKACVAVDNEQEDHGRAYKCPRKSSDHPLPSGNQAPNIKRRILKNIAVFLIMGNISLWILPAFGCRPQYENGLEQETFGFSTWTTTLNFAVPLNLFYRMHSVASLFEVFRRV